MEACKMERPFVVCHMLASLDGKIDGEFLPETGPSLAAYNRLRSFYRCQATLYGTTTMAGGYSAGLAPDLPAASGRYAWEDYIAPHTEESYIVSIDAKGELGLTGSTITRPGRPASHVIEVLTNQVHPAYLDYLHQFGISYLFAGEENINCALLLKKLKERFGIARLMLAGGGTVNWSFLEAGLIDELSLVVAPVADGNPQAVSIFHQAPFLPAGAPAAFHLKAAEPIDCDGLWLRYVPR